MAAKAYLKLSNNFPVPPGSAGIPILYYSIVPARTPSKSVSGYKAVDVDILMTKEIDDSSPLLHQATMTGEIFDWAILVVPEHRMYFTMTEVFISNIHAGGTSEGEFENFALKVTNITMDSGLPPQLLVAPIRAVVGATAAAAQTALAALRAFSR